MNNPEPTNQDTPESAAQSDAEIQALEQLMYKPMEFYNGKKLENEIDLVEQVRSRMVSAGLLEKLPECFDQNRFILEAKDRQAHAQQYLLNRYLSLQLMSSVEPAALERYALIYEISSDKWLAIFDQKILPAIVNYDLPVKI